MSNSNRIKSSINSDFSAKSLDFEPSEDLPGVQYYHIRCLSSVPIDLENLLNEIEKEAADLINEINQ